MELFNERNDKKRAKKSARGEGQNHNTQTIKRAARTMHKKEADSKQILGSMRIKAFVIPLIICYENAAAECMLDCRAIKQDLETTRPT